MFGLVTGMERQPQWLRPWGAIARWTLLLSLLGGVGVVSKARSQSYPTCQPPLNDEYLVLVVTEDEGTQNRVRALLNPQMNSTVCNYLNDIVTRIGGFETVELANQWAQYLGENSGLSTFVASPPPRTSGGNPVTPSVSSPGRFDPRPLSEGYAVLVDYFNNPQVAVQLNQILNRDIGLVSYNQKPYLLAMWTEEEGEANRILKQLGDRGFFVLVVDSRNVFLLRGALTLN
ncbi:hypothetical protein [Oxynema sp. CENA135]|uniref:hypothetical protein n=1 Tax=Oxynema sp. CENA135 TaxID=984206 RepID=UPI001909A9CF|nr:hypothetical protein [Oxynema sp. CENA135]